ncbi:MAG TPA: CdaR family protein [Dehalococcoidia bacterium]|nr:CdaR family protein [Dehalococcoidia bacterium]
MESIQGFFREAAHFFAVVVRPAYRSLRENTGLAGLSVVLAFGLWIFVTDAENPTRTRVLPVDIPVEAVNVDSNVVVANDLASVRVRVSVEENVFESLTSSDFEAIVDLQGLSVGTYDALPVEVRRLTTRGGLRVEATLPEQISVVLVAREAKEIPVVINVTGDPASGFEMSAPDFEESEVRVSGPAEKIALVTQAVGSIAVDGRTERVEQAVRLEPRDDEGNLVEKLTVDPLIVNVVIEIEQTVFSRPVAVSPAISGAPADGYNITGSSSNPPTVTIRGQQAAITEITTIATETIDVAGETDDVVKTVSLRLPRGISVVGSPNVTVTVRIQPAQGTVHFGVLLGVRGLGPGLSILGDLSTVEVTLTGDLPDLLRLSSDDVTAYLDLTGKEAGAHTIDVEISLPAGVQAKSATADPSQVTVVLETS